RDCDAAYMESFCKSQGVFANIRNLIRSLVRMLDAQHKTMFFIVSLDLHVFIDNYPVQTALTTASVSYT
ncbi:hypothetical protein WJ570_25490, partial [Enterobacter hormaechei]|uniref:hypothetical protein n=1 Tax=Enterobacter hormaechei TaxID=158836 RepID=UPI0030EC39E9